MQKLLLLNNPNAAHGHRQKLVPQIEQRFADNGLQTSLFCSQYGGHFEEYLSACDLSQYSAVIVIGGDGTLHEALNGLYRQDKSRRIPLGLIPAGTGNAFARELDLLAGQWQKAVDIICAGNIRNIDCASYRYAGEQRYFINIISMGFGVDAGHTAKKLKFLGKSAYTLATLWQTLFLRSWPLRITLDGQRIEHSTILASVSNSRYTGTSFLIAPDAQLDDGLLDVLLLTDISRLKILRLFPSIYSGKHIHYQEVSLQRAKHILIETDEPKELTPDGEFSGSTPVEIQCLPQAVAFLWPITKLGTLPQETVP
ncbi:MAG: diacylglycerol kinase family lipid kinase [Xanthomonadales bacterium]|nr:diacylglycerol kinase family lipid kinase [Xanthomonadales bacterium]